MAVIPGLQDISTFLGGGYSQPQLVSAQIPGTPQLPQIYNPQNYQPQTFNVPQANPSNSTMLNAIQSGAQNSGSNHAISSGGYQNTPAQSQSMPNSISGLFGKQ